MGEHRRTTHGIAAWLVSGLCLLTLAQAVHADEQARRSSIESYLASKSEEGMASASPRWDSIVALYFWVPVSIKGTSTIGRVTAPLDLDLDQVADLFEFAASGRAEFWRGRLGIVFDAQYLSLGTSNPAPGPGGGRIEVDLQQWNVDLGLGYRAIEHRGKEQRWQLDLLVGGRYVDLKQQVTLPGPLAPGGSSNYLEVFFGIRTTYWLSEGWSLILRTDASGFGWGSGSRLTYNVVIGAEHRFGKKRNWHLFFGYKWYSIDYATGSGPTAFGMDADIHGPYIAIAFGF